MDKVTFQKAIMSAAAEIASDSSEFDIFAHWPMQTSVLGKIQTAYEAIAPVDENYLQLYIVSDNDTYFDLDIKLYIRSKLISASGKDADFSDHTGVKNNFLHSLFRQSNVTLNFINITQASEIYNYRSYLETLMTYRSDAAASHLTNAYWYPDTGVIELVVPSVENVTATKTRGFILRWNRISGSREVQIFRRLPSDIGKVNLYLLPGVRLQFTFTKARPSSYPMNKTIDSNTVFKFLDAQLLFRRVRPKSAIFLAHNSTLKNRGIVAHYNLSSVELKKFSFAAGSKSLSIDNAVLGPITKLLLFTVVKYSDSIASLDNNPYIFLHYDNRNISLFMSGNSCLTRA